MSWKAHDSRHASVSLDIGRKAVVDSAGTTDRSRRCPAVSGPPTTSTGAI